MGTKIESIHEEMDRLRIAMEQLFGVDRKSKIANLSKMLGTSPQTVKNWESRGISKEGLLGIYRKTGISPEWLRTGIGNMQSSKGAETENDDVCLPLYKDVVFYLGEGFKHDVDDYINGRRLGTKEVRLPRVNFESCGASETDSVCVIVSGNSMTPHIPDGSVVAIDKSATSIKDGALHAIYYSGILSIKVLHRISGNKVKLKNYNPDYDDETADISDIIVIGKVFWVSVWHKI